MAAAGTSCGPLITINATEVASAIGRHKWKNKDETMQRVWERADYRTFCVANALENEEEVIEIINRHWKQAKSDEEKKDFLQILFLDWDKQEDTLVKILSEIFPKRITILKSSFLPLRNEIYELIKSKTDPDFRAAMLLREAEVKEPDLKLEVTKLTENEKKPVSESVKEISKSKNIQNEETIKALQSKLNKERGKALEDRAIKQHEIKIKTKVKQPKALFQKDMEYEGVKWRIQGIIDGHCVKGDEVVEVKNRGKRYYCEDHERIQLQTYMFISEKQKGVFLERLKGRKKTTKFKLREQEWHEEVVPKMKEFVAKLTSKIETYRELLEDNKHYYVSFETTTTPESPGKRPSDSSESSTSQEKIARVEKTEQKDSEPSESLSQ